MNRIRVINVVGARPNFMKIAPVIEAMNALPECFEQFLVHTGQHYDERMSRAFFEDLGMPRPDIDLEVGSDSHAGQTGRVMMAFERVCVDLAPDLVVVVGDVNSTLACSITAKKLGIRVAHVEAGLRSRDMSMPEEINRLCTDVICDFLFTTDIRANENLQAEGIDPGKIHFVGNVMIDTLLKHRTMAERLPVLDDLGLREGDYATATLHRPSNVDDPVVLRGILEAIGEIGRRIPVVFPMHPRTRKMIDQFDLGRLIEAATDDRGVRVLEPLGYLEFLRLNMGAKMVLTDSGGLQEETTLLGVPCITLRHNTERPVTCEQGTNVLVGNDRGAILAAADAVFDGVARMGTIPDKWDGQAARRIVEHLAARLC